MLIVLELNELNFDFLWPYFSEGQLPTLSHLVAEHGVTTTTSEEQYGDLEPWIQWVTAHTGLSLAEHGVFRLGDIRSADIPQIWEVIEAQGVRVGAVSPMNASNRTANAAFFLSDPWTRTENTADFLGRQLNRAISQIVNDHSRSRAEKKSLFWLALGLMRFGRIANLSTYAALVARGLRRSWCNAMLLDLLLSDLFVTYMRGTEPGFASLFLNGAAHIQHHYMFNSIAYCGTQRNPRWYVDERTDPVGEVYKLYDGIVANIRRACPDSRLMIVTGLHQDPYPSAKYYWRLADHEAFLRKLGIQFTNVRPLMSRDFLVECRSVEEASAVEAALASAKAASGERLFECDNRGRDVFAMLTWPHEIGNDFIYTVNRRQYHGLRDDVVFVAIKNGQHNGVGYMIDTGQHARERPREMKLADLPRLICQRLGVRWEPEISRYMANEASPQTAEHVKSGTQRSRQGLLPASKL